MKNSKSNVNDMHVIKRNGKKEIISFDKILKRIKSIGRELNLSNIIYAQLTMKVIDQIYDNINTSKIDELTAEQSASMASTHPDYTKLASAIIISNLHKNTSSSFYEVIKKLYDFKDVNNNGYKLIHDNIMEITKKNKEKLDNAIDYNRDFLFDYFGFKTLERAYLMRCNNLIVERPQHMWMRVSLCIHNDNIEKAIETYNLMSQKYLIHATPTLFNAGTPRPQLSSCYLIAMESDSIDGIFNTVKECAQISKWSGGIGLHIHNIRSAGSHIRGTNGTSNGLIPMLGVFNKTARYVDQGGKRNGSFAIYLEPHHPDIEEFLELKKNHGDEESKARDLFYAMWISDLFMERVIGNKTWSLFCPDKCPGLNECYGDKYKELYLKYEDENKYNKQLPARDLWVKILDSQMETGTPYILYKDACNLKSNQQNLGTIKSSNLCVAPETLVLTSKGQQKIEDLKDREVEIWNGKEFSKTKVIQTSDSSELIEVHMSDESILTCTKYHKFYIQKSYKSSKSREDDIINSRHVIIVEAKDLEPNMNIIKCEYPIIDNKENILENPYTNGFFSGDGTYTNITENKESYCKFKSLKDEQYCKRHINNKKIDTNYCELRNNNMCNALSYEKKPHVCLYGEKIKLLENLSYIGKGQVKNNKLNVTLIPTLEDKFFVPINYSLKSKMEWFSGYCDADGSISRNGKNQSLQISSINKNFLKNIKLMLQTCGINSNISLNMNERNIMLPKNDYTGEYKEYNCKPLWRLLIASGQLQKLLELGLNTRRLIIEKCNYQRSANKFIHVKQIIDNNRIDKTYCFNEPKRHAGIFNGIITSQCTEIVEYSDTNETAVCNLASIGLPMYVKDDKTFDYNKLYEVTKIIVRNLNNIIDVNFYPTEKTRRSNFKHRPIGIGVQGLADTFFKMDLPFCSEDAKKINKNIFETIYYAALEQSYEISYERNKDMNYLLEEYGYNNWYFKTDDSICREYIIDNVTCASSSQTIEENNKVTEILNKIKPIKAEIDNLIYNFNYLGAYSSIKGSPISEGIFQFDMWGVTPESNRYDWNKLKNNIMKYGIRNSLLVAPMPTASTSQILGNNECFEPITSNIYSRRTLAGEFIIVNKYLVEELLELGLWNEKVKNNIIANKGSVQYIEGLSEKLKEKYKIVWEMKMKDIIDMSKDRGQYICQSQSLNLWIEDPDPKTLTNMHFYSWRAGLKTGMYYLRRKAKHQAQQFTIEPENKNSNERSSNNEEQECLMCGA
jgi:ribonucleotide reductase alpha subunit